MPLVTKAELLEIVPELRAMAAASEAQAVRDTLNMLANRYAAMVSTVERGFAADAPPHARDW